MNIKSFAKRRLIQFFSFRKPKKQVLFESFSGTQYSADPRAISEKMHEMFPEYGISWVMKSQSKEKNKCLVPSYVKLIDDKMGFIKELASSAAYITTEPLTESFYKRKGQFIVQTWHGDRGIKKVLYESAESLGIKREKIYDNKYTDLCIAASDYGEERYRRAFKYDGEILKIGMPRNDKLLHYDDSYHQELRKRFSIPDGYKVLTYAPTFRGHSENEQRSEIDIGKTLSVLERNGEKWICLVRAHAYSKRVNYDDDSMNIIDISWYPDMTDILVVTDLLITDYSSCAGDFLIRKKPIILVINDEEEYIRSSRTLCVDLEKTGYILSHSQDELENILITYTDKDYSDSCDKVLSFYGTIETGEASEIVCKKIDQHIKSIII